jgi:tRNA U34 2-thiouridine synthase MnmA/TrmU
MEGSKRVNKGPQKGSTQPEEAPVLTWRKAHYIGGSKNGRTLWTDIDKAQNRILVAPNKTTSSACICYEEVYDIETRQMHGQTAYTATLAGRSRRYRRKSRVAFTPAPKKRVYFGPGSRTR